MAVQIKAHAWSIEQTAKELNTDLTKGLTSAEAAARLGRNGPNELKEKPRPGFLSLLLDQFKNFLIIILIAAAILSLLLGEWIDAMDPGHRRPQRHHRRRAGVEGRGFVGCVKKMSAPNARVIRDGQQMTVPGTRVGGRRPGDGGGRELHAGRSAPDRSRELEVGGGVAHRRIGARRQECEGHPGA